MKTTLERHLANLGWQDVPLPVVMVEISLAYLGAGLRAAKARGVRLGRAPAAIDVREARRRRAKGETMRQVADHFNVTVRTLQRYLNKGDKSPPRPAR